MVVLHVLIKHRVLHLVVRRLSLVSRAVVLREVEIVGLVLVWPVTRGLCLAGVHHVWPVIKMILVVRRVQVRHVVRGDCLQGVVEVITPVGGEAGLGQVTLLVDTMHSHTSSTLGFLFDVHLVGAGLIGVFLLVMIQIRSCSEGVATGLTLVWLLTWK